MMNQIRFEFCKLFKNKAFYICTAISVAFILLSAIISGRDEYSTLYFIKSFINAGMVTIVGGVFVASYVGMDFSNETEKNILGRGFSRRQTYISKYIVSLAGFILYSLVCVFSAAVAGAICFDSVASVNAPASFALIAFWLLALHGFYFGATMITGNTGFALAINVIVPLFIPVVLYGMDSLLKIDGFSFSVYGMNSILTTFQSFEAMSKTVGISMVVVGIVLVAMVSAGYIRYEKKEI